MLESSWTHAEGPGRGGVALEVDLCSFAKAAVLTASAPGLEGSELAL